MNSESLRPPRISDVSIDDDSAATRPRVDRVDVGLDIAILLLSTASVYFYIQCNRYGYWQVFSLITQLVLGMMAVQRLSRVKWKRAASGE